MEESSPNKEKEVPRRKATFCFYHPCHFLQEALKPLFKCLGFETNRKEHESSMLELSSDSEEDPITTENNASNRDQKSYKEVHEEESEDKECSTSQSFELITGLIFRPFSRRSGLSKGSDPQIN